MIDAPLTVEPESAPSDAVEPAPAESIADHAAQFGKKSAADSEEAAPRGPANTGQFAHRDPDGRRRATSQRATPEDVAEINRLTKELRETEQRLGDKDPDATSSPRIRTLKRQLAALKALEAPAATATPAPSANPAARTTPQATAAPTGQTFDLPKPTIESLTAAGVADPYEALPDAVWEWRDKKAAFEAAQQRLVADQQAQQAQQVEQARAYHARVETFAAKTPDYHAVTAAFQQQNLPNVLLEALVTDDNGPEYVYYLAQHPDVADQIFESTEFRPVTPDLVARTQRRLKQYAQAATTGSAAVPKPTFNPPRPPNPVRTGPTKTADEPPGDGASIADHARYYGPKRR